MNDIDKNDVNISTLFNWGSQLEIETHKGPLTFWMRIVGDADLNRARVYGLRNSAELRRKLKDESSDEHIALVPDFDVTERDKAIEAILLYKITDLTERAQKDLNLDYPKEPDSDAKQEEHEKYQAKIDAFPEYVEKVVKKAYTKEVNAEKRRLNKNSDEELLEIFEETLINKLCENKMMGSFQDMCVYFSSYRDKDYKKHLFSNIDAFLDLPTQVKEDFYVFYTTLTPPTEELKK